MDSISYIYTVRLQMNGAVSEVNKKLFLPLHGRNVHRQQRQLSQVSHALPAIRFSCLLRGRGVRLQDGAEAEKGFLCAPF